MPPRTPQISARARQLHESAVIIDGMCNSRLSGDYLDSLRKAGLTCTMVPVSISASFRQTVRQLCDVWNLLEKNQDKALIVTHADDVIRAKREGKIGLVLALEDTKQIEDDPDLLEVFHKLGIRRMQITYTTQNSVGCGKGDREGHDSGLSAFGVQVIKRMEEVGILIDLCHPADRTLAEAFEVLTKPAIFSHTNTRAVFQYHGNLTDQQLRTAKKKGCVVCIAAGGGLASEGDRTLDKLVDHIDHARDLIGINSIGIGLTLFEGQDPSFTQAIKLPERYGQWPRPLPKDVSFARYPFITERLVQRGYPEAAIKRILGENVLDLFRKVWDE